MLRLSAIVTILVLFFPAADATNVPGGQIGGLWSKSGSPYYVTGDVTIPSQTRLVVEPGVRIFFSGHYKMEILGSLRAEGTVTDSIVFSVPDTAGFGDFKSEAGGWKGLRFDADASLPTDTSHLRYCTIEYAKSIDGSFAGDGGGIYYATLGFLSLDNCTVRNNFASVSGGGIYCSDVSLVLNNCTISNNRSNLSGGGIHFTVGAMNLESTVITNNSSTQGGGICCILIAPNIINCTICNNLATKMDPSYQVTGQGGGLAISGCGMDSSDAFVVNTIFYGNRSENGNQIYESDAYNTYIARPGIYDCDVEGGQAGISGKQFAGVYQKCFDSLPLFAAPTQGAGWNESAGNADWRLTQGSPCINRGALIQNYTYLPNDVAGNQRIVGKIDLGAYEYGSSARIFPVASRAAQASCLPEPAPRFVDLLGRIVPRFSLRRQSNVMCGTAEGVYLEFHTTPSPGNRTPSAIVLRK